MIKNFDPFIFKSMLFLGQISLWIL